MENKKNRILRVLACLCAVSVLCTVGALVLSTRAIQMPDFNPLPGDWYRYGYNKNSSTWDSRKINFGSTKGTYPIGDNQANNYNWSIVDFHCGFTYDPSGTTNPVLLTFQKDCTYEIIIDFEFSIGYSKSIQSPGNAINWQNIKTNIDSGFYIGYEDNSFDPRSSTISYAGLRTVLADLPVGDFIITSNLSVDNGTYSFDSYNNYFPCEYTATIVFTLNSEYDDTHNFTYLHMPLSFFRTSFNTSNTFYFCNTPDMSKFSMIGRVYTDGSLPGDDSSEDTSGSGEISGENSYNGVSDIVEGQKEAVEHGQDLEQSKAQEALNDQNENLSDMQSVFNVTTLGNSFGSLLNGLMYSGSDFHFYLPSTGQIPYLNAELWQQTEIPFKTYIDSIPAPIMAIIRFLAWFALAVFLFHLFKKILSYFRGGSDD